MHREFLEIPKDMDLPEQAKPTFEQYWPMP